MIYQAYRTNKSNYFSPSGYGDFVGYVSLCFGYITTAHIYERLLEARIISESWFSVADITHSAQKLSGMPQDISITRKSNRQVVFWLVPISGQEEIHAAKPKAIKRSDAYSFGTAAATMNLNETDWQQLRNLATQVQPQAYVNRPYNAIYELMGQAPAPAIVHEPAPAPIAEPGIAIGVQAPPIQGMNAEIFFDHDIRNLRLPEEPRIARRYIPEDNAAYHDVQEAVPQEAVNNPEPQEGQE